ncbi:MAG: FkbM family methyltransferase [Chthoniobacterales bacterium]
MKKFLRRHFNRFLPTWLRQQIKRRLQARFTSEVETKMVLEETFFHLRCSIEEVGSFLAPLDCKDDLVHFTATRDGRAEFDSIGGAAKSGGILFDIGAHTGLVSALFCAAGAGNTVYSFEPSPVLVKRLQAIRDLNQLGDRMQVEQIGIGASTGTMEMLLDPAGGYIQSQRFEHTMWAAPETIQIRLESIPDAAARLGVIPDFIKLDIESYEFEAVTGAADFLSRYKPAIFLELHLSYLQQRNLSAKAVVETLSRCAYEFYTSDGSRLKPAELYDSPLSNIHALAR